MGSKDWWSKLTDAEKEAINERKRLKYRMVREEEGYFTKRRHLETLCWDCKRADKMCPWSINFEPVPGWDAIPTKIMAPYGTIPSYHVRRCPLFIPDEEEESNGTETQV